MRRFFSGIRMQILPVRFPSWLWPTWASGPKEKTQELGFPAFLLVRPAGDIRSRCESPSRTLLAEQEMKDRVSFAEHERKIYDEQFSGVSVISVRDAILPINGHVDPLGQMTRQAIPSSVTGMMNNSLKSTTSPSIILPQFVMDSSVILLGSLLRSGSIPIS
jgi:hypothetical protein